MTEIDKEAGKKLVYEHYKAGNWYVFEGHRIKYMKVTKIKEESNGTRVFLHGIGFEILHDALITPKTTKAEPIVFCWAKDYVEQHKIISEEKVKQIYQRAADTAYINVFATY